MRTLYIRSNKLLRMFSYSTIDVSMSRWNCLEVIVRHCIVPCGLIIEKHHIKKLTVAFNNVHISRRMLNLPWRCSANAMYVNYNLPNLDTVIRRNCSDLFNDYNKSKFNYTCFRALLAHKD